MLELDECDQLLVTNPFADDRPTDEHNNHHDSFPILALSSSQHHPLRSRSVSPTSCCIAQDMPSVDVSCVRGETHPSLTGQLSLDGSSAVTAEEDHTTGDAASQAPQCSSETVIHQVGPDDSFAGVALRYGVSIAALRRANQLWPSDPIHLRTDLLIPRGDTLRSRYKPTRRSRTASLRAPVEPPSDTSPDLVASFVAARNMILSVLPARISLDSLSSKASASEDHELDELPTTRAHKKSAAEEPFVQDGHGLSVLATPTAQHKLSSGGMALPSQISCSFPRQDYMNIGHISSVSDLHLRSVTSLPTPSLCPRRTQPFAVLPVRTSQLEPEPAMELPVRRPRV